MSEADPSKRLKEDDPDQGPIDSTELAHVIERMKAGEVPPEEEVLRLVFGLQRQVSMSMSLSWDYPYPPPEAIDKYCERYPQAAEIIFTAFVKQNDHRLKMEDRKLAGDERRANWGIWISAVLMVCLLLFSAFLAYLGHPGWSIAGVVLAIGSVGGIFYAVSRHQQRDLAEKSKAIRALLRPEKDDT